MTWRIEDIEDDPDMHVDAEIEVDHEDEFDSADEHAGHHHANDVFGEDVCLLFRLKDVCFTNLDISTGSCGRVGDFGSIRF